MRVDQTLAFAAIAIQFACSQPSAPAATISFASVSAGGSHTCGLATVGRTYCWGSNTFAQLGGGPSTLLESHFYPAVVAGDVAFMAVSAGGQCDTSAESADGRAYCWGQNNWGQVGPAAKDTCFAQDATKLPCSRTPVLAAAGLALVTIGGGWGHTCALASDGATYCWGYDGSGQLGVEPGSVSMECPLRPESKQCSPQPLRVAGNLAFVALTVGGSHNCGVLGYGEAECWGGHLIGQLGDCSLRDYSAVPRPVCGGHHYVLLSAGSGHTCGVAVDHDAYCWGPNDSGELGSGTLTAFGPVPVGPPEN